MKKWRVFLITVLSLMAIYPTALRAGVPMKPEDLYRIDFIGDPRLSPDGRWIAFTRYDGDVEKNATGSDIWLIPAEGGEPVKFTSSSRADHSPRWSPDGKTIAFISGRDGESNIYLIRVAGGEARKLTSSSSPLSSPFWSDDGRYIICTSRVLPQGKSPRENWTEDELPECQARTIDHLLFRQWNRWLGDKRNHLFMVDVETGEMKDLTPGDEDVPPVSLSGSHDFDISPDGGEVCYVKNTDPMPAVSTNHDIYILDTETMEETRITPNPALDSSPRYSPCGRYIAYRAMEKPGYESDRACLVVYDRKKAKRIRLTGSLDRSVRQILWEPGGDYLYFTARDRGRCSIYRVNMKGNVERLSRRGYSSDLDITPDGEKLVFVRSYSHLPPELYSLPSSGGEAVQLTSINSGLASQLDLPPLEEFWFEGAEGDSVHGFIQKPPGFEPGSRYPVVLCIHGGPQGMWADSFMSRWFTFQLICSPGYVGVFINPRGSAGYNSTFREQVSRDYGGRCYRDLMKGLDYVIENYDYIDSDRQAAIGGSFGGYSVNWIIGKTDRFSCTVSHAGLYNLISFYGATEELWFPRWDMGKSPWEEPELYHRWSPHRLAGEFETPTLIIHGQRDYRVPFAESLQLFTALKRQKVPARLVVFPDEGHVISKPQNNIRWWREIHRWLGKYLKN